MKIGAKTKDNVNFGLIYWEKPNEASSKLWM